MKKSFHMISLLALLLTFAVSTAWAAQRTLTADGNGGYYINMPATGTDTLVIPNGVTTFKVYDDGGKNGNFSYYCDGYLVIRGPEEYFLRVTGNVSGNNRNGHSVGALRVWGHVPVNQNGAISFDEYESMGWFLGNVVVPKRLSSGQELMLRFWHYSTKEPAGGLNVTVSVVNPNSIWEVSIDNNSYGGEVYSDKSEARTGEVVSLTAIAADGYYLDHIEAIDERNQEVEIAGGTWLAGSDATFTMPSAGVEVTAVYASTSQWPVVFVQENAAVDLNIPSGISGLNVVGFDSGEEKTSAPFVLMVCEGCLVKISSSDLTGAQFVAYNGTVSDLSNAGEPNFDGISTGRTVTLFFTNIPGRWPEPLPVEILDMNKKHPIIPQSASSGMGDVEVANFGSEGAPVGSRVKLVALPDEGYKFSGVRARYVDDYNWTDLDVEVVEDSVWFTMPYAEVRIVPDFAPVDNPYFLVPLKGVSRKTLSEETSEISVCDDGGCEYYYDRDDNGNGMLVLTAPEGYILYAYGNVNTASQDYLEIFDGADTNANLLFKESGNDELYRINSSTQSLTFRFNSTGWGEGFNIKVGLINMNAEYEIEIYSYNGTASSNVLKAKFGDTITVTGVPDEGYVFYGIDVYDENENFLFYVEDGVWYNGVAKFVMPSSDVFIDVDFEDMRNIPLEIKIPKSDTLRVSVPEGIMAFNVVDDGGSSGNYSDDANGVLVLTAPEGYSLAIGVNVDLNDENDSLYIYDGAGVNGTVLAKLAGPGYFFDEKLIYSTGRSITYRFKSDGEGNASGIWTFVVVLKKSGFGAVAAYEMNGSTVARVDGDYTGNEVVSIPEPIGVDWIEYVRKFTAGVPSTVILPFTLPEGTEINADFYQLTSVVQDGRKWKATMTYIGEGELPKANTPYAIIPEDDHLAFTWDRPNTATLHTNDIDTVKVSDGDWLFVGTYSYKTWAAGDDELGLAYAIAATDNEGGAKKGQFGKISAGASATPFQAYLRKKDSSVQLARQQNSPAAPGTRYSVDFVPEETIDVEFVKASTDGSGDVMTVAKGRWNMRTGEFKMQRTYDIKGRKLNGTPKTHGAYYGKKVLKK